MTIEFELTILYLLSIGYTLLISGNVLYILLKYIIQI